MLALIRFLSRVRAGVDDERRPVRKPSLAVRARIGFLSRVRASVFLEVVDFGELPLTNLARIRFDSGMNS